jgi:hypothetical protein
MDVKHINTPPLLDSRTIFQWGRAELSTAPEIFNRVPWYQKCENVGKQKVDLSYPYSVKECLSEPSLPPF